MNSCIYEGLVSHNRLSPHNHYFCYSLYMMYLDLDELPELFDVNPLWSSKRPALAWFRRKDHVGDNNAPLGKSIRQIIKKETGREHSGAIRLLTHLRYFGYCMNPVSLYYCWNDEDNELEYIVAEVHNTPWGETHCYVLDKSQLEHGSDVYSFLKSFHVSPFMEMDHVYQWHLPKPDENLMVNMDSIKDNKKYFNATMNLKRQRITSFQLSRVLFVYPFMTIKVISTIYLQAMKLWIKKTPFYSHPKNLTQEKIK
jgi:uncharacterized protein